MTAIFDTQDNNLSLGCTMVGTGNLTKIGVGKLTLAGTNTYSGGTTLEHRHDSTGQHQALGAAGGNLTVNAGTLDSRLSQRLASSPAPAARSPRKRWPRHADNQLCRPLDLQQRDLRRAVALIKQGTGELVLAAPTITPAAPPWPPAR